MSRELGRHLLDRIDRPLAWSAVFGICGVACGAFGGLLQGGIGPALLGGFAGGVCGAVIGLAAWVLAQFVRLANGLLLDPERPVRRPDLWGHAMRCTECEWRTTPEGPWRRRDCLFPPQRCPACGSGWVVPLKPPCPRCGAVFNRPFRWPTSWRQALWGGDTCRNCGLDYDKWGRPVLASPGDRAGPADGVE